jgi:hypothetical protein
VYSFFPCNQSKLNYLSTTTQYLAIITAGYRRLLAHNGGIEGMIIERDYFVDKDKN